MNGLCGRGGSGGCDGFDRGDFTTEGVIKFCICFFAELHSFPFERHTGSRMSVLSVLCNEVYETFWKSRSCTSRNEMWRQRRVRKCERIDIDCSMGNWRQTHHSVSVRISPSLASASPIVWLSASFPHWPHALYSKTHQSQSVSWEAAREGGHVRGR